MWFSAPGDADNCSSFLLKFHFIYASPYNRSAVSILYLTVAVLKNKVQIFHTHMTYWYFIIGCDHFLLYSFQFSFIFMPLYHCWCYIMLSVDTVSSLSCSKSVYKPLWRIPLLSVQWINSWWWTEELSETCRVSCQNKFVKLVHLVGFIIKKYVMYVLLPQSFSFTEKKFCFRALYCMKLWNTKHNSFYL